MIVLSLVWGILAIAGMLVAFLPCLGWMNWFNIPFSGVGLIVSVIALATSKQPNKGGAVGGLILCGVAVVFGIIRLVAGGGVL
jgi:hypothetical protein